MNTKDNKEEFQYYNDEWNRVDEKFKEELKKYQHLYDKYLTKIDRLLQEELIKNNKPDGRRYKK